MNKQYTFAPGETEILYSNAFGHSASGTENVSLREKSVLKYVSTYASNEL